MYSTSFPPINLCVSLCIVFASTQKVVVTSRSKWILLQDNQLSIKTRIIKIGTPSEKLYGIIQHAVEHVFINLPPASCSSTPTKETYDERQSSNIKETKNGEETLRQKRCNELFEGIIDLNNKHTNKNEDDTLKYTVDKINDKVIITINNNVPNTLESITPFYKVIDDDVVNLTDIDKEKCNKNIIKVYLVGSDDNILKLKREIKEKSGDELLVYFYKQQDRNYQNLGCFYTSSQHLLHVLSKYTHYFSINDQSLKHICSSNDSDIKPAYKQSDDIAYDPHRTSIKQNIIQKPENVLETHVNDREYKAYNPDKKTPSSYEFLVKSNNDLHNEDVVDTDKLKCKGQKDKVQYEAPGYNNIYIENNKPTTEFNIRENPKDETELLLRDKSTNVETTSQNPVPCNTNIKDGVGSNMQFHIPHTTAPNLYNLVNNSPNPKPYLPWNIANFNNYGKPCTYKGKSISNTNPAGYEKVLSKIEVRNKIAGDKLNSAIHKLSEEDNNKKNQGIVTFTPILPVSLSPLPTPYLQTNLNPVLNIPYTLPGLQNLPIKSSAITPSFNQKAEEQNHQNKIDEELGKPRKSNIYQTFPYSLTSPVNNILSKPIISSSLQIVPTNVCHVPELTIGKNIEKKGENNMLSTGLSASLASLSESPETLAMSSSASPISELTSPCAEILSEPKLPLQSISTNISDIPKINSLPVYPYNVCNVPELTIGKNIEKKGENNMLVTGLSPSLASLSESPETLTMSSSASPVSELTSPFAEILSEPKLPLQSISTTISDIPKINSLPVYPNNVCNVPELTIEKNIEKKGENNMLSTGIPKINSLPICDIPSVVPNFIESVSSTLEAPPLQIELSNPITETVNKPMSSLLNTVTKLDVPSIGIIKENDMSLSKVSDALSTLRESINPITLLPTLQMTLPCNSMLEKESSQIIPTIKHNVPKISVEKDSENITQMFETSTYPTTSNEVSVIPTMPTPCLEHSLTPPCTDTFEIPSLPQIVSTTISNVSEENFIKNATITDNNIIFPEVTNQNISPTTNVKSPDFSPNLSNYFEPLTSSINPVPTLQTLCKSVFPHSIKDNTNSVLSIPHIVQTSPNQLYFPSKKTTRPHNIMFKYPPPSYPNLFFTTKPMPTSQTNTSAKFNFPKASSIITGNGEPDNRKMLAVPTIIIPTKTSSFGPLLSTNSPQTLSNNRYFDENVHKTGNALLPNIPILPATTTCSATDYSKRYKTLPQELTNKFYLSPSNVFNPHLLNPTQSDSFDPLLIQKSNVLPQEPTPYFSSPFYTSESSSNPASILGYFPSVSQRKSHPYMDNTCKPLDGVLFPSDLNKIPIIKSFSDQNQPHMHFPSKLPDNLPISNLPMESVSTNTINNKLTYLPLNNYSPQQFRPSYHLPLKLDYSKSTQQPLSSTIYPLNLKLQSSHYKWPYNNYLKNLSPSCKSKEIYPHVPLNTSPEYSSKVFEPRVTATPYPSTAVHISKTPVSSLSILPTINNGSNAEILPSNVNILPSFNLLLPGSSTKDVISELYDTSNSGKQNLKLPIPTLPTPATKAESIMSPASISSLPPTLDAILSSTSFQAPVPSLNMYPASTLSSPIITAPKLKTTSFNDPSLVYPYASSMELSPTISPSTVSSWPIVSTINVKPKNFKLPSMDLPISLTKKDSTMNPESISPFPSAVAAELTFPNQRPLVYNWPITSTEEVSSINNMPPFSPLSFKVTPEVCATRTKKPIYEPFPIHPSKEVCVKNSPPFEQNYPVSPTPKLRMTSFNPCTSCLYMPPSRTSDLPNLPNYVSPLPISSTPERKSVNLQSSKSLSPVSPMIETNSEVPVISAPQLSAFPKKVIGSTSYSFNIPSTSDSMSSELDLTDLLARNSPLPAVSRCVTAQPKSTQCFHYPKKTLCSSKVSANKLNMQPQSIKICNKPDYFNLKSVAQPQSQLFDNPLTYNSPTNYFKSKVVLSPQSSNNLNSDYLTGSYTPMSYIDTAAPNLDSNSFPNNLSYKFKPSITCSNYNPDTISHDHYPTHKSSATLTKPNSVPKFPEKQEMFIPLTQENKYSNSYLSNIGYKDQTSKLLPSEIRPSILTSKLSKKSKLKINYTSPESLSSAPFYHNENVIKLSPYKDQNEFSNEKTFSPYLSPDKKTQINFDTEYLMNTPNLYQTFDKFVPSNLKVLPNEKLSSSFRNTFRLTPPSIGLTQNNLITNLRPYAKDVCVSDKKVTIPIANILVAKYEPNRFEKINNIDTDNPDIKLKMWLSKINTYKAKLIVEVYESNVTNFIPIVKNKGYYSPEYIQDTVKRYVEKYYGKPIVLNGTYSFYSPYALINNVNEIKKDDIYVIWPTFCECGCNASGCQCCYK